MPRFTSYDAPTRVAGGVGGRAATAADFGADIGAATQQLGKSVSDIGDMLAVREERRQVTEARARLSEFKTNFAREELERQQAAPVGAPGHFDATKTSFDDQFAEFSSTLSPVQQRAIAAEAETARSTVLSGSLRFQSEQTVKADLRNVGVIRKGYTDELFAGGLTYSEAVANLEESLAQTTIGAEGQAQILAEAKVSFREAITNGLLTRPIQALQLLEDSQLDFLTAEERSNFEDSLVDRVKGQAKRQQDIALANFARAAPETFMNVISGKITLDQFPALRKRVPEQVGNSLFDLIVSATIPERTPEEMLNRETYLQNEFVGLDMTKKRGSWVTGAELEEVLRFQTEVIRSFKEGFIGRSAATRWLRDTGEAIHDEATDIEGQGTDYLGNILRSFGLQSAPTPYQMGVETFEFWANARDVPVPPGTRAGISRRFMAILDDADDAGQPITTHEDARAAMERAIVDQIRSENPDLAFSSDLPTVILSKGGVLKPGVPKGSAYETKSPARALPEGHFYVIYPEEHLISEVRNGPTGERVLIRTFSVEESARILARAREGR